MKLAAFYHVYCGGAWQEPLTEYLEALDYSGFRGPLYWGAVGPDDEIIEANGRIGIAPCAIAREGYEQVTLAEVARYAARNSGAVMYAHTKGASDPDPYRSRWRRAMTLRVVDNWRSNLEALNTYQAVGCLWQVKGSHGGGWFKLPFFAGNFWMARCDYLRTLPECPNGDRMEAEEWLGMNDPKVLDVLPGWPSDARWPELC
jgi:hypothetical protein